MNGIGFRALNMDVASVSVDSKKFRVRLQLQDPHVLTARVATVLTSDFSYQHKTDRALDFSEIMVRNFLQIVDSKLHNC